MFIVLFNSYFLFIISLQKNVRTLNINSAFYNFSFKLTVFFTRIFRDDKIYADSFWVLNSPVNA